MAKQNEWLVYFYENRDYHRHTKFFKKGFKHCGVMGYDPEKKIWLIEEESKVNLMKKMVLSSISNAETLLKETP